MDKEVRNFNRRYAKEYNIFRTIFFMSFLYIVVYGFYAIFYNYKIEGRENLPKKQSKNGKYIYAANHVSIFDPPMVVMGVHKPIAFMAKKELFENNEKLSWLVKRLGAFAVDREKLGVSTIKTVKNLKNTDWVLGIFPQGTRQEAGEISHITKGFASLAKSTKCGILPVGITGTQEVKRFPFSGKIIVRIGKVIPYTDNVAGMVDDWEKSIEDLTGFKYVKDEKVEEKVGL